ncbi:DUF2604 domain-containing protein [Novosphingobium sp. FSW06-99]|uniref:DUF2604 domain-containing protein n=1 Tax=Novosphingobium sp. FSW06-99 TaxID=1739113 RepID=UPI00076DB686|nr:DUF2604 domain-containing protein [Novosphingobium sp. FSW06-99]KUR78068.1 hypothetical protein AQZ49_08565 [Novosphingobium sp. FSW06-99]
MAKNSKFEFEVEGVDYLTGDPKVKGRDIRTMSDHNPAAKYRLIEVMDRYTTSVGLEDPIEFVEGEKRIFRIAEGDRDFDFTVEDLGWEWCSGSINEADVRKYGRIADDRELFIEGPVERVVPRGGTVDLTGDDVERIYSRPAAKPTHIEVTFIINGEGHAVKAMPDDRLVDVLNEALKETENTGRPVTDWIVTTQPGAVLDVEKTLTELGIVDGTLLVASLKTGEAG